MRIFFLLLSIYGKRELLQKSPNLLDCPPQLLLRALSHRIEVFPHGPLEYLFRAHFSMKRTHMYYFILFFLTTGCCGIMVSVLLSLRRPTEEPLGEETGTPSITICNAIKFKDTKAVMFLK